MTLVALRDAVVDSIDSEISAFVSVKAHGGRFNLAELQRIAMKAPAARVAILGGPLEREGGSQAVGVTTISVFIITRGSSDILRDEAVLTLVEAVAGHAVNNTWGYAHAKAPEQMRIDNLYSGAIDRRGVALWAVSWVQQTDLAMYDADALLDDLHQINVKYDLADKDGVTDMEDDIWLNGEFMSAYGHIYISTSSATAISVSDTYQKLGGTTTLKEETDFSMPASNRLNHDGTIVKPFLVSAGGSITVDSDAKVTLALAEDGTVDEDTEQEIECTSAEGAEPFSLRGIFNLDEDEYVEVWVKADDTINVTATKMNLIAAST